MKISMLRLHIYMCKSTLRFKKIKGDWIGTLRNLWQYFQVVSCKDFGEVNVKASVLHIGFRHIFPSPF